MNWVRKRKGEPGGEKERRLGNPEFFNTHRRLRTRKCIALVTVETQIYLNLLRVFVLYQTRLGERGLHRQRRETVDASF